jgi:XTP/dITP diphosphohydrolase
VVFPSRLALATRNRGKIKEILEICAGWPVEWLTYADAPPSLRGRWPDVQETGSTYRENALLKARALAAAVQMPAVADDSGIEVAALQWGPGPRSARFAGDHATDQENLGLLISRIRDVPREGRLARYVCVAAYCVAAYEEPSGFQRPQSGGSPGWEVWKEGTCDGSLITEARGTGGFGYDPIFVPAGVRGERTMAELDPAEKNAISHRGRAFRSLGSVLEARDHPD